MTDTDLWVRRFHPADDAATRLLCLPHAGGSASYFFGISQALSPDIDVLAVQYPGRQDRMRERGVPVVSELADRLVAAMIPLIDRPITIFGHSLGATLGFEVALRLEAAGITPTGLFASARRAPSCVRVERAHLLDDAGLIADVRALAGTKDDLLDDPDVVSMVLPAIRSDYTAAETYVYTPGPRLSCPVFALAGESDPKVKLADVQPWAEHTDGDFSVEVFPGGHFYLNDHVPEILRRITAHVGQVTGDRAELSR